MVTSNSLVLQALSNDSEPGVAYNRWRARPSTTVPVELMAVILIVIKFGQRQGVFIKARWAALARPVELLLARAMELLALELEPAAGGLGLPCTQKKSQAGRGQEARGARWIQRPGLLLPRRQMLYSFFYFPDPPTANIAASS